MTQHIEPVILGHVYAAWSREQSGHTEWHFRPQDAAWSELRKTTGYEDAKKRGVRVWIAVVPAAAHAAALEAAKQEGRREGLELYRRMKNCAAGYSNLVDDSGTTRRLEREFEQIDAEARALIEKANP